MKVHSRQAIRENALKILQESEHFSKEMKESIFHNRAFTFLPEQMPVVKILGGPEDADLISKTIGLSRRNFNLIFEIMTSTDEETAQDQADSIALSIEKTLKDHTLLGENVSECWYQGCRLKDHDGKGQIVSLLYNYEVTYELSGEDLGWYKEATDDFKETHMQIEPKGASH